MSKKLISSIFLMSTISVAAYAEPIQHYIIAPNCLLKNIETQFSSLSTSDKLSLIQTNRRGLDGLIAAKANHKINCGGFMNVTHAWQKYKNNTQIKHSYQAFLNSYLKKEISKKVNYKIRYKTEVRNLLKTINPNAAWTNLTTLTNFQDRYADSNHGVEAAQWFAQQIKDLASKYNRDDISVSTIETTDYKQPSVVVKIGKSDLPGVVIGGHMDTLSSSWSKKPGADDDGSGSVTVLETARTIIASGTTFKKPIYIIWYAAEEEGLIGSQEVVDAFKEKHIPIDAVIHFDMTGFAFKNDNTMWLIDDHVNKDLTAFLEKLITTYVKKPVEHTACGYACSDHASWTQGGFTSSFPFEASFGNDNPYIHSSNDTMDHLSLSHLTDYVKLGVAFAVELAEPNQK